MSSKVEQLVQEFVANLRAAIAEDASEMFKMAAGGGSVSASKSKLGVGSTPKKALPAAKERGGKRTSEDIAAQAAQILSYLKKNPGQGAEQLGGALGMTTGEMALPIKKLIADKAIKATGQKRGTKYTAK